MILALDIGNSQIYGGVFCDDALELTFRTGTRSSMTSDDLGVFLRAVLKENGIKLEHLKKIAVCSVVPNLNHSIRNSIIKYFKIQPFFLQAGVKTGLKIKYRNPLEVGADRIANAIAATHSYPRENIVVIDFGTATTFCAITRQKEYLGGIILPGLQISMEVLAQKTAQLPSVEIRQPKELVGRSTAESIQSGLYFGHLVMVTALVERIHKEYFNGEPAKVLGTGGFSRLYQTENIFDVFIPDLVLHGLNIALKLN